MSWKYIDDLLLKFSRNSTVFGKFWVASVLIFRLIVITLFAESVWSDEQREFTCNTKQPGCENICFNKFTPLSNSRLWGFHTLAISLPGALYFTYVIHVVTKNQAVAKANNDGKKISGRSSVSSREDFKRLSKRRQSLRRLRSNVIPSEIEQTQRGKRRIWHLYILQIVFRVLFECVFVALQLTLYSYRWRVPEVFSCSEWPCPHTVDCFISRPHEKTVIMMYMYATAALSIIISCIELWYITWASGWKTWELSLSHKDEIASTGERIPAENGADRSRRNQCPKRGRVSYL